MWAIWAPDGCGLLGKSRPAPLGTAGRCPNLWARGRVLETLLQTQEKSPWKAGLQREVKKPRWISSSIFSDMNQEGAGSRLDSTTFLLKSGFLVGVGGHSEKWATLIEGLLPACLWAKQHTALYSELLDPHRRNSSISSQHLVCYGRASFRLGQGTNCFHLPPQRI